MFLLTFSTLFEVGNNSRLPSRQARAQRSAYHTTTLECKTWLDALRAMTMRAPKRSKKQTRDRSWHLDASQVV